jgi:hypothetical protein
MRIKLIAERLSSYWIYRKRHLPIGADLRVDLERVGLNPRVIFDVGANIGQTYRRFRRDFPDAQIHCFEPVNSAFQKLTEEVSGDDLAWRKGSHWLIIGE